MILNDIIWYDIILYFILLLRTFEQDFFPDPYGPDPLLFSIIGDIGKNVRFTHFKVKSQSRWRGLCLDAGMCVYIHTQT